MLDLRLTGNRRAGAVLALPVAGGQVAVDGWLEASERARAVAFLADATRNDETRNDETRNDTGDARGTAGTAGTAGTVYPLPRPAQRPYRLLFVDIGDGAESAWRAVGAALSRAARYDPALTVALPPAAGHSTVRGIAEGLWLGAYRYRLASDKPGQAPRLRRVNLVGADPATGRGAPTPVGALAVGALAAGGASGAARALAAARAVAEATWLARDLTNAPSNQKSPAWLARQVVRAAGRVPDLAVEVWDRERLAGEGFGGVLAVGRGSVHRPRLVRLDWSPPGATTHVVLVGKGITFDTGGISLKPRDSMKLMRKDMGGAAAVLGATLGAATLRLPVRVTALAPLAENAIGSDALRPGDVVRHHGGTTSEITNTDAEGRLVLADALGYAARTLRPDVLVDLATLTGAQSVALGKRTAALYTEDDDLAGALSAAAHAAGERVWRMPLIDDYLDALRSDIADMVNSADIGAGSVTAALYLRAFTGTARGRWAHLDMSAPAWSETADGELAKGATGWGVRTLVRWLESLA